MSLESTLDQLEDKFYGEYEEDRAAILKEITALHKEQMQEEGYNFQTFSAEIAPRFGGIYIPYLFWEGLNYFFSAPEYRIVLSQIIADFADSNFEEEERKLIKPLLVTYFNTEKEFELDKLHTRVIEKAHPSVQEYFESLTEFVTKNKSSVEMYVDKFDLVKNFFPNFELMALPLVKLKERLAMS